MKEMMDVKKISFDELDNVSGGFNSYVLSATEKSRYKYLRDQCLERNISPIIYDLRVSNLTTFCKEMKAKYGDSVDPGNLLG